MTTFKGQLVLALVLNVGLKVLTFTLSTLLTRKLLPYQNGVYFTFNVYNDAVLFVAREATRSVASRLSILEEKDENEDNSKGAKGSSTSADEAGSSSQPGKPSKKVGVANVRRMICVALCSVPLAMVAALALEVMGICFGGISMFPSMLRHARLSHLQQYATHASPRATGKGSFSATIGGLPLLLLPYLPELTVVGCTVLMALVEPCVVVVQSLNLFRVVVLAECATLTARLVTVLLIVYSSQRRGVDALQADGEPLQGNGLRSLWEARMALAFGQLAYAVTHVVYYAVVTSDLPVARYLGASAELQQVRAACLEERASRAAGRKVDRAASRGEQSTPLASTAPKLKTGKPALTALCDTFAFPWCFYDLLDAARECRQQAALLLTFLRESMLRLVLSEGESFALTSLGSEAARGYYQLIYSLGSLVARLLFRVWENACFVKWSREASLGHRRTAVQLLKLMLRLSFYVGFSFALLGPPLSRTFLLTMYTSRWATPQVTKALQLCFYGMPFMAWNGLLEAFLRAVASPAVLQRLQRWMIGETVVYIAACYVTLLSFGKDDEQGDSVSVLVLLNTLNMLWRCGASLYLLASSPAASTCSSSSSSLPADRGEVASTESVVHVHDFVHLFAPRLLVAFLVLFIASRTMAAASVVAIAAVGVAYGAVIFACDAEVRRLLVGPVWSSAGALLCRRHGGGAPRIVAATTMTTSTNAASSTVTGVTEKKIQ